MCGETDAWDGSTCMVCGFVSPPKEFQDPNVDMHKQLDLRQKNDMAGAMPGGMPPTGQPPAMGMDMPATLTCPNCGFETEAAAPESIDTADVQGMPGNDPEQPGAEELDAEQDPQQGDVEDLDAQEGEPQEGDPTQEPEDPAGQQDEPGTVGATEGDLCPNCGQAPLESANTLAEESVLPPNADGVPDDEEMQPGDNDAVGDEPADDEDLDDQDPEQGPGDSPEDPSSDEPEDPDQAWPDDNDDEDEDGIPDDEEDGPRKARPPR